MKRLAVGAIIYDTEMNYLLVHKVKIKDGKELKANMDSWDFSKGGVLENEDKLTAIKRELWEETGSKDYEIEKEFYEKICFNFTKDLENLVGFTSQETTMFLVRYIGDRKTLKSLDDEIDSIIFYKKDEILNKLSSMETKEYWMKYLEGSLY